MQVYFLDSLQSQLEARQQANLRPELLQQLSEWFLEYNHLVRKLRTARDQIVVGSATTEGRIVIREDKRPHGEHARRYNAQSAPEVGILMPNEPTQTRDIVVQLRNGNLQRICELHPSYDPLQYPIAFPHGTDGYHIYLQARHRDGQDGGAQDNSNTILWLSYYGARG